MLHGRVEIKEQEEVIADSKENSPPHPNFGDYKSLPGPYSRIDDYELKASITLRSATGVPRRKGGALLLPPSDV